MADESDRDRVLRRVLGEPFHQGTSEPVPRVTVHVLHEGRALCGKPGVPGSWEPGHKWVYRNHDEGGPRSAVNCPGCLVAIGATIVDGTYDPFEPEPPKSSAEHDQAVLAELGLIPDHTLQSWIDRHFGTVMRLAQVELARRRAARANRTGVPSDERTEGEP